MRQRGLLFPSPVVMLSIIAVAMAAIAFVATRGGEPTERVITPVAEPTTSAAPAPSAEPPPAPAKPARPAIKRDQVYVEVYNNSGISGLAGRVAERTTAVGWSVVGSDNWYGTIPTSTVYHPKRLAREAKLLARDLGIERTALAVGAMRMDRLTLVLTGELD
ncbi:LytR C-terminal domain-containing protein [Nocardioides sp. W7]|uniref:LytR C-terminal domain-containing protein n=1 Tax=Nocardioides sp. W7 TaxID=2931390 RepID=UPI001FD06A3E|nr:LytR C-terminal domain-containing protein [Nocardioides sp. W7]